MKTKNKDKNRTRTITVKPLSIGTSSPHINGVKIPIKALSMDDLPKKEQAKQLVGDRHGRHTFAPGNKLGNRFQKGIGGNPTGISRHKSMLDLELEKFLEEYVNVPGKRDKKTGKPKRDKAARLLVQALFRQAILGLGKGRIAQLIFERVGGRPEQRIDAEGINAVFDDPQYRRNRIRELQKTLKIKLTT